MNESIQVTPSQINTWNDVAKRAYQAFVGKLGKENDLPDYDLFSPQHKAAWEESVHEVVRCMAEVATLGATEEETELFTQALCDAFSATEPIVVEGPR